MWFLDRRKEYTQGSIVSGSMAVLIGTLVEVGIMLYLEAQNMKHDLCMTGESPESLYVSMDGWTCLKSQVTPAVAGLFWVLGLPAGPHPTLKLPGSMALVPTYTRPGLSTALARLARA